MLQMLLSINPEYVDRIVSGEKLYEYRKFRCRDDVNKIIIYATSPRKMVIGEVTIAGIIEDTPARVWEQTKDHSGITYDFFQKYYEGKEKAVAYQLSDLLVYERPKRLSDIGVSSAPQSYRYIL